MAKKVTKKKATRKVTPKLNATIKIPDHVKVNQTQYTYLPINKWFKSDAKDAMFGKRIYILHLIMENAYDAGVVFLTEEGSFMTASGDDWSSGISCEYVIEKLPKSLHFILEDN